MTSCSRGPSARSSAVEPFRAMAFMAEANRLRADGCNVLSLAVGQPASPAPQAARDAAHAMIRQGRIAYTDAMGRIDLRRAIAGHYRHAYGVEIEPSRVMITSGASGGFNIAFLAAFEAGDNIALASPGYPAYRNIMRALGIVPVEIEVGPSDAYILTRDHLEAAFERAPFKGLLIASPANPTGTMTPPAEMTRIAAFCRETGVRLISDEIYHRLSFGVEERSALQDLDEAIILNSFSKYYCMTGWRIGWMVLPADLVKAAERLGQNIYISAPELSQVAGLAALGASDELDRVRDSYLPKRRMMMDRLPAIGFQAIAPIDGAFYAYAQVPQGFHSATAFAEALLAQCHVALTPGLDFDPARGDGFVRLSYAGDETEIAEALDRIAGFVVRHG
ncbi:aminotransferase class I/II-fold pyridoxal phosphate-dependent enzyme [Fulvimarina sp. 2208YS6-2-32]|uniref:aspartate transaminase n=1 Tax=Fulvimarina uroteuthidis TaxID=3098149 RepID=A0ABU5I5G6_9HYPH|nr:aminotransferase class I/II-fold pyridoxal phosphate-dependent enzyme [Fulvimarina sp. 2208YS6-2-32]MDY8110638.1 aminotransferase class I/II-fold pyridoxal phosphate-dependent enzyme [Fulvimarina sp. 2208YS6-2-32]